MLNQIIGLLLIAITTVAMNSTPDEDQIEFIEDLNEIRRAAANVYKIKIMHELTYSEDLAEIAEELANGKQNDWEEVEGFQEEWRCFYLKNYVDWQGDLLHFFNDSRKSKVDMELRDNTVELLVPLQKEIGCSRMSNGQRRNMIFSKYKVICVIGKEGSEKSWIESQDNPNKKCSPGYKKNYGLCIPEEDSSQLDFIDQLNKIRRKVAKKHGYPNMHKLVFSRKLARMAQYLILGETPPCLHDSCRFTEFHQYDTGHKELDDRFTRYISLSPDERRKEINDSNVKGFVGALEHVVPLQTEIGCSEMKFPDTVIIKIFCFLGSNGTLDSLNLHESAGTTCLEHYQNDDGLCVQRYEIGMKNDEETTEQPEITIDKNNPKEASTVPTQDSVTAEAATAETTVPKTLPTDGNSNGIPSITPSKITSAPFARPTTTESELDRLIAKYQREEQDGDLPSEEDEVEYEYSNSRQEYSKELAGMAELVVKNENVTGFQETWRHTVVKNYSKGQDELGSLDSFYTSLNNTGSECSSGCLFIDGLCCLDDGIEVKYGSVTTQQPVIESSQSVETTTNLQVASKGLENLKPEEPFPTAPLVGSIPTKLSNRLSKNSNQPEDSTSSTVKPNITPIPFSYGPKTTVETELDRLIAKYQREEQDGDLPSEEDEVTHVFSSGGKVSLLVSVVFVMTSLLID
ncbi:unnamed protein product [Caenorhabditis brenneri]